MDHPINDGNMQRINMLLLPDETTEVPIAVASTGTAYSHSFPVKKNCSYALLAKLSNGTSADVKLDIECGLDKPATEFSSDSLWSVEDSGNEVMTLTVATRKHEPFQPPAMPYMRIKATGQSSNPANQTIEELYLLISPNHGYGN